MPGAIQAAVILPAAGGGTRYAEAGGRGDKLDAAVGGRSVLLRAAGLFLGRVDVVQVIVAAPPGRVDEFRERHAASLDFHDVTIVAGGEAGRWETVALALEAATPLATHIAVHDAARPVTSGALLDRVFAAAAVHDAVVPGEPVSSTLKRVGPAVRDEAEADAADLILGGGDAGSAIESRPVLGTVPREGLVAVQTPQVFRAELFRRAYAQLAAPGFDASGVTDDAGLVEALGEPVAVVPGESTNVKVTVPADVELCDAIARSREAIDARSAAAALFDDDDED